MAAFKMKLPALPGMDVTKDIKRTVGQQDPVDPRISGFADWLKLQRRGDLAEGQDFASTRFGAGNKDMAEILTAKKDRAFGDNKAETDLLRSQGVSGINSQLATGLRSLKGLQGASGIRGGAAIGQALPHLAKANLARSTLEGDIALGEMRRRDEALRDYESTLTGERAGQLGTMFGFAGLGAGDRSSAMQHILGSDFLRSAQGALAGAMGGGPGRDPGIGGFMPGWDRLPNWGGVNAGAFNSMIGASGLPQVTKAVGVDTSDADPRNWRW